MYYAHYSCNLHAGLPDQQTKEFNPLQDFKSSLILLQKLWTWQPSFSLYVDIKCPLYKEQVKITLKVCFTDLARFSVAFLYYGRAHNGQL